MKLEPCPFCGAEDEHLVYGVPAENPTRERVKCCACGTAADRFVWNTRPIESALRSRIAALEARLENPAWPAGYVPSVKAQRIADDTTDDPMDNATLVYEIDAYASALVEAERKRCLKIINQYAGDDYRILYEIRALPAPKEPQ